jgi:hypothetical protein
MAARASDSHPPGQLDDSRGSMPSSILPAPPAAGKQKLAMSQKWRPASAKIGVASMIRTHGMSQNLQPPSLG